MTELPWVITCYGLEVDQVYPDAEAAKKAANRHIRSCPEGEMRWARRIEWHLVDDLAVWVSAANGEWLNHHVRQQYEPEDA